MTIYEIDSEIQRILSEVDENGELPESAFDELEQLNRDRETKIENAACMVLDMVADAKKIREQEKALAERRKTLENHADRIRKYIEQATNGAPFSTARVSVKYTKSTAVEIDNEVFYEHPAAMFIRQTIEPDKTAIKAALKDGATIPGASLVERKSLTIK